MTRLHPLDDNTLDADQREAVEEVISGPRGKVPAPMQAWLRNPELARRAQRLGALLRFDTGLGQELTELAILVCAAHWRSHYEWTAHRKLALQAGLDEAVIEALLEGRRPDFHTDRHEIVHRTASELMTTSRLSDATYADARTVLGETLLVELVAVLGYYSCVALTLNAFEIGMPDARVAAFDKAEAGGGDV
mgnify:CR=1 FL=1